MRRFVDVALIALKLSLNVCLLIGVRSDSRLVPMHNEPEADGTRSRVRLRS